MTRRTQNVTIDAEGRDKGKTFVITEMPADLAERWATRALVELMNAGVELPDGALHSGMAGIAAAGVRALGNLSYERLEPLLVDMWACVQYVHAPGQPPMELKPSPHPQFIEEVKTRLTLRLAVLELHLGFSLAEFRRTMALNRKSEPDPASSST